MRKWAGFCVVGIAVLGSLVMAQGHGPLNPAEQMIDAWQRQFVGPKLTERYNQLMVDVSAVKAVRPVDDQNAVFEARILEIKKLDVEIQILQLQRELQGSQEIQPDKAVQEIFHDKISSLEKLRNALQERDPLSTMEVER